MSDYALTPEVAAIGRLSFRGNVTPESWYQEIRLDSDKAYLEAIVILAEIVYWYRPSETRDESTGQVIGLKKKFKSDKLQRNYQALANKFGFTKRQVANACHYLQRKGLIDLDFRTIAIGEVVASNVLFIGINPDRIEEITFVGSGDTYHFSKLEGSLPEVGSGALKRETNTSITPEITSKITLEINTPLTPKGEEIAANQTSLFSGESQDQKTNPCQNSKSINQDIPPVPQRPPSKPPKLTEADFDRFWEIVKMEDGKSGKAASLKKFLAIKGVSADTLIQARIQQQEWHRANRGVLKYLSVPNNWLRDGRWEDEMKSSIAPSQHSSPADLSLVRSPSELAATDQEFDSWWNRYLAIVSEINDIPCQGDRNQALNAYKELLMAGCTEEMLSRSLKAYYDQSKERWLRGKQVFMTSAAKFLENDTWKVAIAKDEVKAPTQAEQTNTAWADRLRAKHGAVAL